MSELLLDTRALTGRSLRHVLRSPDTIVTTAVLPIAFLLLFVYVFGGAVDTGSQRYVDYLLPGILVITVATGTSYTALRLFQDLHEGIVDRLHTLPIARSSVLWAHVLTSVVASAVALAVVVGVAFAIGFRTSASLPSWLAAIAVLLVLTLALTWVALVPGLAARSVDGATGFSYPLIFLPFVSSAFVPTETMPGPLRAFAEHQPVTAVVDALRGLLLTRADVGDVVTALGWCVAVLLAAIALATRTYRRRLRT